MGDNDIVITYETIFELLKQEKEKSELQKIDEGFFERSLEYIKGRKQVSISSQDPASEAKKAEKQIENIKKMLKELYDRREKKIINLALDSCRITAQMDCSKMLKEEKQLFDSLFAILGRFRKCIIDNVVNEKPPTPILDEPNKTESQLNPEKTEKEIMLVRFLSAVPKFVGEDLEEYGPFEEEDMANLPREIAKVLVIKNRAEEIEGE